MSVSIGMNPVPEAKPPTLHWALDEAREVARTGEIEKTFSERYRDFWVLREACLLDPSSAHTFMNMAASRKLGNISGGLLEEAERIGKFLNFGSHAFSQLSEVRRYRDMGIEFGPVFRGYDNDQCTFADLSQVFGNLANQACKAVAQIKKSFNKMSAGERKTFRAIKDVNTAEEESGFDKKIFYP